MTADRPNAVILSYASQDAGVLRTFQQLMKAAEERAAAQPRPKQ